MKINKKKMYMKKCILILSIACLILGLSSCCSKSDWVGIYSGIVPCADCPGIETQIALNADNTYQISQKYQDKGDDVFQMSGTFQWNADKSIITLENLNETQFPTMYKLGKGSLIQLDLNGKEITGNLAQNYVLTKVQ
jgi:uncharacterized lipoprotein NlpE involved in copper resistance